MSTTVPIPGGTATLRDPEDLTERGRRLLLTTIMPLQALAGKMPKDASATDVARSITTRQEAAAMMEVRDAAIIALLKEWTRPEPLPTLDTLLDLDHDVFTALEEAVGPFVADVLRAAMPTNFEPQDPSGDNPFGGSATSGRGLKVVANGSSGKRRTSGASTSTAATSGQD